MIHDKLLRDPGLPEMYGLSLHSWVVQAVAICVSVAFALSLAVLVAEAVRALRDDVDSGDLDPYGEFGR